MTSAGYDSIWIIGDRLTKSVHFLSVKTTYSMAKYARVYLERIGVMRLSKKGKLTHRYMGPLEIIDRIGEVTYKLDLPLNFSHVHPVFHISILRKYISDSSHVLQPQYVEVSEDLTYEEQPVMIMHIQVRQLHSKIILMVKVLWQNHSTEERTWETKQEMRDSYSHLFQP
ncbi:uncharacterized protein LOC107261544 [Ricinus communis]|uniref:uncharacterized protein LOC107261544 n=1 Tax=Ricinus communis TaxID=3988 RepID=UPI0007729D45|nr:uncharacterized protein LOC107261544 [Ricinus communis]|eukprot:XP_015577108.1 uncharacterized protein LOC107261544 [Ricinus communis]